MKQEEREVVDGVEGGVCGEGLIIWTATKIVCWLVCGKLARLLLCEVVKGPRYSRSIIHHRSLFGPQICILLKITDI